VALIFAVIRENTILASNWLKLVINDEAILKLDFFTVTIFLKQMVSKIPY